MSGSNGHRKAGGYFPETVETWGSPEVDAPGSTQPAKLIMTIVQNSNFMAALRCLWKGQDCRDSWCARR